MRFDRYIVILLAAILTVGCGVKKKAVSEQPSATGKPEVPAWHTCLIQNARATVITDEDRLTANVTMQTVHDSMLVISIMPMLGMEMLRVEATPMELTAIDKIHGRYAKTTFAELNKRLTPSLNWDELQQLCTAELPTGEERARCAYILGEQTIELVIEYSPRKTDVPVRVMNQKLDKYTQVDISKWL